MGNSADCQQRCRHFKDQLFFTRCAKYVPVEGFPSDCGMYELKEGAQPKTAVVTFMDYPGSYGDM